VDALMAHISDLRNIVASANSLRATFLNAEAQDDTQTLESVRSLLDTSFKVLDLPTVICLGFHTTFPR
jgi:hypothetical protein